MITSLFLGLASRPKAVLWLAVLTCLSAPAASLAAQTAAGADCPGHPGALGTARTLVVDPHEHPLIGTMQYAKALPLEDHEVVLTFDDGPLPKYSNQILDILAAQCVKATFFLVGRQANANPEGVRKVRDAGHTVATHSQNHPAGMQRMPIDRARQEIEQGIASVTAALGDGSAPAPFFRIPGLARNDEIEEYATSAGLQLWSADFPADDWRNVSAARVYDLAIQRLEAKGKGILLLHDIQPRTVAALPRILNELKARGYRVVHVVPATPERPATPTEPQQWQLHPPSETVAISRWPKIPNFVFAAANTFPAPAVSDFDRRNTDLSARAHRRSAAWPQQIALANAGTERELPVPGTSVFNMQESIRVTMLHAGASRRVAEAPRPTREAEVVGKPAPVVHAGKSRRQSRAAALGHVGHQPADAGHAPRKPQHAVHVGRAASKPATAQVRKNAHIVRVAGLKKR